MEQTSPRLLSYQDLKRIGITYARESLWRLERANKFPRRIYLSSQQMAWFEAEILAWLEQRSAERATRVYRAHD